MIVAKSLNKVHNLVEQKDIKETVLFESKTNIGYVAEWVSKSLNYGCAIDCIVGVNRGGVTG